MLTCIQGLLEALHSQGIRYCHWKSNFYLKEALEGIGDLDLIIDRKDVQRFEALLASLGFKRGIDCVRTPAPSIFHFYGLDNDTGTIVHLHVYYRLISGETLIKNYGLPIEKLLLIHTKVVEGIRVPQANAELMLFVLRMTLKHASVLEYLLLRRNNENIQGELKQLLDEGGEEGCAELIAEWLPQIEICLFKQCLDCLKQGSPLLRQVSLALKLRGQMQSLQRFSSLSEWVLRLKLYGQRIIWRQTKVGKSKQMASGGAIIAFVGPEATGKSTLVNETKQWLGTIFQVSSVHLGKPPSTWVSTLPNLTLPLMRNVAANDRVSQVANHPDKADRPISVVFAIRSALVAWDRYQLALKIRRQAVNGTLVICDRYPSTIVGAMDSARLKEPEEGGVKNKIIRYLANLEHRFYKQIPPADIVIRLNVPVDVAMERNQNRQKHEDEDYVLRRHTTGVVPSFPKATTLELNSNRSLPETLSTIRRLLWEIL